MRKRIPKRSHSEREIAFPSSYIYKMAVSGTRRAIRRATARREVPLDQDGTDVGASVLRAPAEASPHFRVVQAELFKKRGR